MSVRERLAEIEHEQWVSWSQAVARDVAGERRLRWEPLWIPYSELTEEQKDQDRKWADKAIAAIVEGLDVTWLEQQLKGTVGATLETPVWLIPELSKTLHVKLVELLEYREGT